MKLVPSLLLNAIVVTGGLLIYDAVRSAAPEQDPPAVAPDLIEPVPAFDEDTLRTIGAYMDEIYRRKSVQRQREKLAAELIRLDIGLDEDRRKAVTDEVLSYQDKARTCLRKGYARDEEGRALRRTEFMALRAEFTAALRVLVPPEQAEQILETRAARSFGFATHQPR